MRAKKSGGARFTNNELALSGLDHLGKLSRQLLEVGCIDAALGGIAEGGLEVGITGRIDHRNLSIATSAQQLLDLWQRVPGNLAAAGGKFVDGLHNRHRL